MKKLTLITASALLLGCDGGSDSGNQGTRGIANVNTKNAVVFMQQAQTGARSSDIQTCGDYFTQVGEQGHNQPDISNLFDFHYVAGATKCEIVETVASQNNLFLKGAFIGFELEADGSGDVSHVDSCVILKVPMHSSEKGGGIECIARGNDDDDHRIHLTNSGMSVDKNGTLRFIRHNQYDKQSWLMEYDENINDVKTLVELNFKRERDGQPESYITYSTDGDKTIIIAIGDVYYDSEPQNYTAVGLYNDGVMNYYHTTMDFIEHADLIGDWAFTYEKKDRTTITDLSSNSNYGDNVGSIDFYGNDRVYEQNGKIFTLVKPSSNEDYSNTKSLSLINPETGETTPVMSNEHYDFYNLAESDLNGESVHWVVYVDKGGDHLARKIGVLGDDLGLKEGFEDLLGDKLEYRQVPFLTPVVGGMKVHTNGDKAQTFYLSSFDGQIIDTEDTLNELKALTRIQKEN
ncbi:hypothetical protein AB4133_06375 [Vibrio sp. 10N.286.52.F8]|uniref:hypothetical protein n=1 Tax=Vibrio sp. 10N.286.52.F8 TaxID=3229716 RepID=UPI0035505E04